MARFAQEVFEDVDQLEVVTRLVDCLCSQNQVIPATRGHLLSESGHTLQHVDICCQNEVIPTTCGHLLSE